MTIVTAVVVAVFGTLTLVLHDETFIKVKPTMIYALFGAILGGGLLFGRSFIAVLFESVFNLTAEGWRKLTIRWAIFFFAMALLNEIVWRTQTTDFWVAFKLFGAISADARVRHAAIAAAAAPCRPDRRTRNRHKKSAGAGYFLKAVMARGGAQ